MLGDAHIDQVTAGLKHWGYNPSNPLHVEFIKLSHHGSRGNINKEFLDSVRTNTFIVCQAYENLLKHPDRETIAKIAMYGQTMSPQDSKSIFLTKDTRLPRHLIFPQDQKNKYKFSIMLVPQQVITYEV